MNNPYNQVMPGVSVSSPFLSVAPEPTRYAPSPLDYAPINHSHYDPRINYGPNYDNNVRYPISNFREVNENDKSHMPVENRISTPSIFLIIFSILVIVVAILISNSQLKLSGHKNRTYISTGPVDPYLSRGLIIIRIISLILCCGVMIYYAIINYQIITDNAGIQKAINHLSF